MALINFVSTGRRRSGRTRGVNLSRTSEASCLINDVLSGVGSRFQTSCCDDVVKFLTLFVKQISSAAHPDPSDDSMANKQSDFLDCGEASRKFSDLLWKCENTETDSKTAPTEGSFLKQSLSKSTPTCHMLLEGIFVHLYTLWWHFNSSALSCCELSLRTDATRSLYNAVWDAGLKRLTAKRHRDGFQVLVRWKGRTVNMNLMALDGCWFPLRPFGALPGTPASLSMSASSSVFPFPPGILEFDALQTSVRQEPSFLLVEGIPGNGKTRACDMLSAFDEPSCACRKIMRARPDLPLDFIVGTTNRWRARLVSLSSYLELPLNRMSGDSMLLLDDFDKVHESVAKVLTRGSGRPGRSKVHNQSAIRPTTSIQRVVDLLRQRAKDLCLAVSVEGSKLVALATARDIESLPVSLFDHMIELQEPRDDERRALISEFFFPRGNVFSNGEQLEVALETLVVETSGRTWSELMRKCREGITERLEKNDMRLSVDRHAMRRTVKGFAETSARDKLKELTGQGDSIIRVFGPNDLSSLLAVYRNHDHSGALLPWDQRQEWAQLEAGVLTPLCHSQDLRSLLRQDHNGGAEITEGEPLAGVLLTGASGSGKTSIARHCAAFASSLLPSLCLIEVNCVRLVRKEIGESERAIRQVFDLARSAVPCLLVLDGVENIATVRGKDNSTHGTMDRILSTLLTHMDGVQGDSRQPAVIGVTVHSDWVDQTLCRPGRLAMTINVAS